MSDNLLNNDIVEILENYSSFSEYVFIENLKKRKIIINEEIDDTLVENVIMQIYKFNEEDENIPVEKRKPIKIYLNSCGGYIDIGLCLCNVIKQSKTPVYIYALGRALSMAALILMAGHKRYAYPFTSILIHDGSTMAADSMSKFLDAADYYKNITEIIKQYILENTKITPEFLDKNYRKEMYLTAQEALELGIIDEILGGNKSES
jgi:ATP-dependent Clp protease protease subunit